MPRCPSAKVGKRAVRPTVHREIRVAKDRPEGIAVALCMPGRVARELCSPTGVRSRIFDDDLRRLLRIPVEELVRRILVPGEAAAAALELEQELVLAARPSALNSALPVAPLSNRSNSEA